jgi:hypothetical protein
MQMSGNQDCETSASVTPRAASAPLKTHNQVLSRDVLGCLPACASMASRYHDGLTRHCLRTALERLSAMSVPGRVSSLRGESMITVTYLPPNGVRRQRCSSTSIVVTPSNRVGAAPAASLSLPSEAPLPVRHDAPRPRAALETVRWWSATISGQRPAQPRATFVVRGPAFDVFYRSSSHNASTGNHIQQDRGPMAERPARGLTRHAVSRRAACNEIHRPGALGAAVRRTDGCRVR